MHGIPLRPGPFRALLLGLALLVFLSPRPAEAQERACPLARVPPSAVSAGADCAGATNRSPRAASAFSEERQEIARGRNDAMLNGALIAVGALGVADNVISHWILDLHRAVEDSPHALQIEIGIVAVSAAMMATGIIRERRARRGDGEGARARQGAERPISDPHALRVAPPPTTRPPKERITGWPPAWKCAGSCQFYGEPQESTAPRIMPTRR
jgi:hypothetical protein